MILGFDVRASDLRIILTRYFHWIMAVVIVVALLGAFRVGLDRGFDHTIGAEAWGRLLFGIGGAITQIAHGGGGYVIDGAVETVLQQGGLTGDPKILASLGTSFPANLVNAALIDAAIQRAVHLSGPVSAARGSSGDDPGMVDFVRIAFSLFGYNLLSLYLTYFILFSVPVWLFFRAFRDRPACVAILAVLVLSHLAIFASAVFDLTGGTLGSPTNPRFLSVLAIVPGLHIGLAIVLGLEPSRRNVGLTALQAGMIVFACWIRSSAVWVPFGLLVLAACVGIRFRSLRGLWSLGLLAALFLLHSVYLTVMLDPVYRRSGDIGRHPMWHSIFYSLQLHPEWKTKYAATYHGADGDDLTPIVAKKYLERHPPADLQALYFHEATGTLKWAALESVVRSAFFEFAVNDPTFVLAAFLIHKPRHLFQELRAYVQSIKRLARPWRYFVIASSLLMIAFFASSSAERRILNQCAALVAGGFVVSLIPIILTVTFRAVISDQFFMLVMATTAVSLAAASGAVSGVVWLVGSRRWLVRRAAT